MPVGSRPLRRLGVLPVRAGAVAIVAIVAICPLARADDPPPPLPLQVLTGDPVRVAVIPAQPGSSLIPPGQPSAIGGPNPLLTGPGGPQNAAPKVNFNAGYTIPDLPGTFNAKVEFPGGGSPVAEQRVLAADTAGKAIPANLVRVAYRTNDSAFWVFFPGTGRLEKVGGWPAVYPGIAPAGRKLSNLSDLFGGPGGPEWLQKARTIVVLIAAAVITGGAVAAFGIVPALQAMAMAVPLAW